MIIEIPLKTLGCEYDEAGNETWYMEEDIWTIHKEKDEEDGGWYYGILEPGDEPGNGYWDIEPTLAAAKKRLKAREKEDMEHYRWIERGCPDE